jgi:DNA-binding CsgD family transcriptional regulator
LWASVGGLPLVLTAREAQVLELLRDGLTAQQIAIELGVSPVTVRRHLGAIAAKAGKRGRTDLLRLVDVA